MTTKSYNGWTNYETWVVNLWMDNDAGSQDYWRERAKEILEQTWENPSDMYTAEEQAVADLASEIQQHHEEAKPEIPNSYGVFGDLISAAMSEVNWREIAASLVKQEIVEMEGAK